MLGGRDDPTLAMGDFNDWFWAGSVRRNLARVLPDVEVTEYDPEQKGRPSSDFVWHLYDAVLLDYELGMGETGLDWLKSYARRTGFPPGLEVFTGVGQYSGWRFLFIPRAAVGAAPAPALTPVVKP